MRATGEDGSEQSTFTPPHMPSIEESGLGRVEYDQAIADVSNEADPLPKAKKSRSSRGTYTVYTPKNRAEIGKYALENGNKMARQKFLAAYPSLNESTVRDFKKAYRERMRLQKDLRNPEPITAIACGPRGRPALLMELDIKLIKFLQAVRSKGGVINIHVVRAATKALIDCNSSTSPHLINFAMPRSWVQSIYR